jgi:hypothetical protein
VKELSFIYFKEHERTARQYVIKQCHKLYVAKERKFLDFSDFKAAILSNFVFD